MSGDVMSGDGDELLDEPLDTTGDVIDASSVIVCCGSAGVGKTTTAAVLGLEAARRGRRASPSPPASRWLPRVDCHGRRR